MGNEILNRFALIAQEVAIYLGGFFAALFASFCVLLVLGAAFYQTWRFFYLVVYEYFRR